MAGTVEPASLVAARQPSPATDKRRWRVLAVVVAAQFMFVVDAFIVNVALPSIGADLHASAGAMDAVLAVYQIAYASLVITGARLGDIFGRRRIFVTGVLAFTAASAWCGLAGSGPELVLARLVQGATAALMVPQVLASLHTLFPGGDRGRAFAVFGVALGLGGTAGFAAALKPPRRCAGMISTRAHAVTDHLLPLGIAALAASGRFDGPVRRIMQVGPVWHLGSVLPVTRGRPML